MAKFAVLSHILPPSPSGQAVVLSRLLSGIPSDSYYLISGDETIGAAQVGAALPARAYRLPPEVVLNTPDWFGFQYIRSIINLLILTITRTKNLVNIFKRCEPGTGALIACSGNLIDIPAGFLASKITRMPFYAYLFDDYVYQWMGNQRLFSRIISPFIFKHATGIIGPNEFICEEYKQRYSVNITLIRNPCDQEELAREPYLPWPAEKGSVKIIYTGAVYHANFDCFQNLIQAMELLREARLELHIFTSQSREHLESHGIKSGNLFLYGHMSYAEILEQQYKADILFLPLAFESPIPQVIRSSAPGKMGEYLASGRPVLAHVPADSFVSDYFNRYQCGVTANHNDPDDLATQISGLIDHAEVRAQMIANARERARIDFSPSVARNDFMALLKGNIITGLAK